MQTAERLNSVMDHLGVETAFFAAQVPGDIADLAWGRPDRIKGLLLCVPTRLDARPFERVAPRLLMISGEKGLSAQVTRSAHEHLREAQRHTLQGYNPEGWSDVVADRTAEVAATIIRFLTSATEPEASRAPLAPSSGTHAGLMYRIEGQQSGHPFRRKSATCSDRIRPPSWDGPDALAAGERIAARGLLCTEAREVVRCPPRERRCGRSAKP